MTQRSDMLQLEYHHPEGVTARYVLVRWEKFRILYNAILMATVLGATAFTRPASLAQPGFWFMSIAAGVVANLCFCLGPFIDVWCFALGRFSPAVALVLFTLGAFISFLVTLAATLTQTVFP